MKFLLVLIISGLVLGSCVSQKSEAITLSDTIVLSDDMRASQMIPKAIIYQMTGAATAANVPIKVNNQGVIISYPDPSDLNGTEPIELGNGYYLDRRGISPMTRFLRYTYAEYSALATPPSIDELQNAIIDDARTASIITLPITLSEALADIEAVKEYIPKK